MPATNKIISVGYGEVKPVIIGKGLPLVFLGGPCAIESYDHSMYMAENIQKICMELNIDWIFKSCYDKDCRSSPDSFHGIGSDEGMKILSKIRSDFGIPVVSDFSDAADGSAIGEVCDLVQVPAYLCRQTSILKAAAETKRPIHLKKGQFMSPWNMKNSVRKLEANGCKEILLAGADYPNPTATSSVYAYIKNAGSITIRLSVLNNTGNDNEDEISLAAGAWTLFPWDSVANITVYQISAGTTLIEHGVFA